MRRGWAALGLLILVGAAWVFLRPPPPDGPGLPTAAEPSAPRPEPGLLGARGESAGQPAPEPEPSEAAKQVDGEIPSFMTIPPGMERIVRGTVVLVDSAGSESAVAKGTLELTVWMDESGYTVSIPVRDGAWTLRIHKRHRVLPNTLTLAAGQAWFPELDEPLEVPADGRLHVRAFVPPPTTLRVLDAESRAELQRVFLFRPTWRRGEHLHPGLEAPVFAPEHARPSPLTLAPAAGDLDVLRVAFFVWSPGYAWGRASVAFQDGGERRIYLRPAGGLDVTLTGRAPPEGAVLRIRPSEGEDALLTEVDLGGRTNLALDNVRSGFYEVTVALGEDEENARVLGHAAVSVAASERARVTVEVADYRPPPRVPYAGELVFPAGWKQLEAQELALRLLDPALHGQKPWTRLLLGTARRLADGARTYPFDAGVLQPGTYRLDVPAIGYVAKIQIEAPGTRRARLDIPPPVRVLVRIVGAEAHPNHPVDRITWHAAPPADTGGFRKATARRHPTQGVFRFTAPQGKIVVGVKTSGYLAERVHATATAPRAELKLVVRRTASVLIITWMRTRRVGWDWKYPIEVHGLPLGDRVLRRTSSDRGFRLEVEQPGTYRLQAGPIPGFEPVPPQDVEFVYGQPTVVNVRLVPLR